MTPHEELERLIRLLSTVRELDAERFAQLLGAGFKPTTENRWWRFFSAELTGDLFTHAELRLHQDGDRALLLMSAPRAPAPVESDLGLDRLGEPAQIDVNPDLPPEGVLTYVFCLETLQISVQLSRRGRELQAVVLQWAAAP